MTAPSPQDIAELERKLGVLPALPWELWTSCSYRRITGPDGKEGGVLHAYNQRSDNHPDLSMPEDQLFALVDLVNAIPQMLAALRERDALRVENERHGTVIDALKRTIDEMATAQAKLQGYRVDAEHKHAEALEAQGMMRSLGSEKEAKLVPAPSPPVEAAWRPDMFWCADPDGEGAMGCPEEVVERLMDFGGYEGPEVFEVTCAMSGPPIWCVGTWPKNGDLVVTEYASKADALTSLPTPPVQP